MFLITYRALYHKVDDNIYRFNFFGIIYAGHTWAVEMRRYLSQYKTGTIIVLPLIDVHTIIIIKLVI